MSLLFPATQIYYTPFTPDEIQQVLLQTTDANEGVFSFRMKRKKYVYSYEGPGKWEVYFGSAISRTAVSVLNFNPAGREGLTHTLITIQVLEPRVYGYLPSYWLFVLGFILTIFGGLSEWNSERAISYNPHNNGLHILLFIAIELAVIFFYVWLFERGKKRLHTFLKDTLNLQPTLPNRL